VDQLVVVTHPEPLTLTVRSIDHDATPEGSIALEYAHEGRVLARGVVTLDAVEAIEGLLMEPISLALAATEDPSGNIEARVCLVLPLDPDQIMAAEEEEQGAQEPWKASVPSPPAELGLAGGRPAAEDDEDEQPRLALLPIGNVIRARSDRKFDEVALDAREMLDNLVAGRARDAVSKAIDDLLDSL
jgi:hypothetical protein